MNVGDRGLSPLVHPRARSRHMIEEVLTLSPRLKLHPGGAPLDNPVDETPPMDYKTRSRLFFYKTPFTFILFQLYFAFERLLFLMQFFFYHSLGLRVIKKKFDKLVRTFKSN